MFILWLFVAFKENAEKKMLAAAILVLKKALMTVFENEIRSWYFMLSNLLFSIVIIVEVVNWGASNGVMVVSNKYIWSSGRQRNTIPKLHFIKC